MLISSVHDTPPHWRSRGGTGAGPHTSAPLQRRSPKNSGSSGGSLLPTGKTPVPGTPPYSTVAEPEPMNSVLRTRCGAPKGDAQASEKKPKREQISLEDWEERGEKLLTSCRDIEGKEKRKCHQDRAGHSTLYSPAVSRTILEMPSLSFLMDNIHEYNVTLTLIPHQQI